MAAWRSPQRPALLPPIEDISPDAIVMIDAAGIVRSFNPAAERLFGYSRGEVAGANVKMLMPPHFRSEHDAYIGRYVATR